MGLNMSLSAMWPNPKERPSSCGDIHVDVTAGKVFLLFLPVLHHKPIFLCVFCLLKQHQKGILLIAENSLCNFAPTVPPCVNHGSNPSLQTPRVTSRCFFCLQRGLKRGCNTAWTKGWKPVQTQVTTGLEANCFEPKTPLFATRWQRWFETRL